MPSDLAIETTNTLFGQWQFWRSPNNIDAMGIGFAAENRVNCNGDSFVDMTGDLGTVWSSHDATSDDYTRITRLWFGQRMAEGKFTYILGKIDPTCCINGNRFAGNTNTQYFGQPFATNQQDRESYTTNGWALSFDQNLGDDWGVFFRHGNDGDVNAIEHLVPGGVSWLKPFGRKDDQAGLGLSWTHPSDPSLREEYSTEIFYRLQATRFMASALRHLAPVRLCLKTQKLADRTSSLGRRLHGDQHGCVDTNSRTSSGLLSKTFCPNERPQPDARLRIRA